MSGTEAFVTLPPDSSGKSIRLLKVVEPQQDGTYQTAYQEVLTLADEDGTIVGVVDAASLKVADVEMRGLLRGIVRRLDTFCAIADRNYEPPDALGAWDEEV